VTPRLLSGRTAIVTGAGSGIGAATSVLLASEGANLILVDRQPTGLASTAQRVSASGGECRTVEADVSIPDAAERAISEATQWFKGLHILVNNAGIALTGTVVETLPADWDMVFGSNVRSAYLFARAAIPHMQESGGGAIVTVASEAGLVGFSRYAAYSASKAALINLTRSMALDHASDGIRVNCVCPGSIDTPLLRAFYDAQDDPVAARLQDEMDHPLGIGHVEDVAEAVLYLASTRSSYVTGHALVVDGGYTAR
jgi:NAD(P)-dependent dehydrogenase (short-subunit alcohol dehydrogenase family)